MKTIEIRIPELGKASGTTSYVAEKLQHIANTIKASETRAGEPCLTYQHWSDKNKDGNPKTYILCYIPGVYDDGLMIGTYQAINDTACVHPVFDEMGHNAGLFRVLTEPAERYVNEFLDRITSEFREKWNNEK